MKNPNKLYWIKKEITQIENQIKELTVLSAVAMDGSVKGGTPSSPVERFYDRLEKLSSKLVTKCEKLLIEQERIENYIETIDDEEIRVLARERYIECKSYKDIGEEHFMDRTTVYRKLQSYNDERMKDNEE